MIVQRLPVGIVLRGFDPFQLAARVSMSIVHTSRFLAQFYEVTSDPACDCYYSMRYKEPRGRRKSACPTVDPHSHRPPFTVSKCNLAGGRTNRLPECPWLGTRPELPNSRLHRDISSVRKIEVLVQKICKFWLFEMHWRAPGALFLS